MNNKRMYVTPLLWSIDVASEGSFLQMAPSGHTDTGDNMQSGGDDEEGREGDAKRHDYDFSAWE